MKRVFVQSHGPYLRIVFLSHTKGHSDFIRPLEKIQNEINYDRLTIKEARRYRYLKAYVSKHPEIFI